MTAATPTSTTSVSIVVCRISRFPRASQVCRILLAVSFVAAWQPAHAEERGAGSTRHAPVGAATADGPPVDVLCQAAVAQAMADPERARSFVSRARLAGWLPEVRFRVYRRFARTEGLSFDDPGTGGVVAPVDISAIDDVRYEWRATWDLSRIVFNPDELQAHSEALRMSDVRRDIQALVIRLYFERRRLMLEATTSPGASDGTAEGATGALRNLRVAEIEAQLDVLSGGIFFQGDPTRREAAPGL